MAIQKNNAPLPSGKDFTNVPLGSHNASDEDKWSYGLVRNPFSYHNTILFGCVTSDIKSFKRRADCVATAYIHIWGQLSSSPRQMLNSCPTFIQVIQKHAAVY
ncbi:hypothetical protein TNCV_2203421 [Trichonephila clavipes]|nr:hypothetical protein TNCV_2203421 [Trichonephila clavipes]